MITRPFGILRAGFVPLVSALLLACLGPEKQSTEVTDPSLVTVHFTITKGRIGSGAPGVVVAGDYSFMADVLNPEGRNLEIRNGGVSVNGIPLVAARRVGGGPGSYYDEGNIAYAFDSAYAFIVTLSDGSTYSTLLRTPPADLGALSGVRANDTAVWTLSGPRADSVEAWYVLSNPTFTDQSVSRTRHYGPGDSDIVLRVPMEGYAGFATFHFAIRDSGAVHPAFAGGSTASIASTGFSGVFSFPR